jgi:hypothetical protein
MTLLAGADVVVREAVGFSSVLAHPATKRRAMAVALKSSGLDMFRNVCHEVPYVKDVCVSIKGSTTLV